MKSQHQGQREDLKSCQTKKSSEITYHWLFSSNAGSQNTAFQNSRVKLLTVQNSVVSQNNTECEGCQCISYAPCLKTLLKYKFYQNEEFQTKIEEENRVQHGRQRGLQSKGGGCPRDESFAAGLESNIQIGAGQRAPGRTSLTKRTVNGLGGLTTWRTVLKGGLQQS